MHVRRLPPIARFAGLCLGAALGCSGAPAETGSPSAEDAGSNPYSIDAAAAGSPDAATGLPSDAGLVARDAGAHDAAPKGDGAGATLDAALHNDSDAGALDASALDAAASSGHDAAPPVDASSGHDAAPPVDASLPKDAAPPLDAGAKPPVVTTEFAPYFPTWVWGGSGYAITGLSDLQKKAGVNDVTIAFVLSNGGCNTTQDIEQNIADVKAFVAAGGHVKASFGGADGTYLESKCTTAATWAAALEDFVKATGIVDLDFDIEQDPVLTDAVNAMRGAALKQVQTDLNIDVAFTLAANPSPGGGLTSQGLSVVSHAVAAGVRVAHVNLMTMDYGDSFGGQPLAPVVEGSLTDATAELMSIVPGMTLAQAWAMLGVIPMIGKNDDSEVFSLDDAKGVAAFATSKQLGLVSFWSLDRDQVCESGEDYNSCSTVNTVNFQFSSILGAVVK